ncbi:hypothetical protein F5Y14DRAFT_446509 [Nemania sp. NC0429]|nr:hypothetical protein F5Y14DRAFT_446509 [Nemania sp. NC0429]
MTQDMYSICTSNAPTGDESGESSRRPVPDIPKLCQAKEDTIAGIWENLILTLEQRKRLRKQPWLNSFDAELLLLAEAWYISLGKFVLMESEDPFTQGYWPFAMVSMSCLIMTCHDFIYRSYMRFPGFSQADSTQATHSTDSMGRGVPESEIATARAVITELASVNFGVWLEKYEDDDAAKFRNRRSSFNVSFIQMDIEWALVDNNGDFQHIWASLSLVKLFPEAKTHPEKFRGPELLQEHRRKPMTYLGQWTGEETSVSELDLDEENIGWKPLIGPKNLDADGSMETHADVSDESSRRPTREPRAPELLAAPPESREDWLFTILRHVTQELEAMNARVTELECTKASAEELESTNAHVTELESTKASVEELEFTTVCVAGLEDDMSNISSDLNHVRICLEKLVALRRNSPFRDDDIIHEEESLIREYIMADR